MNQFSEKSIEITLAERDAVLRQDFHAFARKSFEIINVGQQIEDNWHLHAITKSLVNVFNGKTRRLIINAPPRSLKSYLASVALPAYALGHTQSRKFVCVSYSQDLANKHSSDTRRLMESKLYRRMFRNVSLSKSTENELQTKQGGFRFATSVDGTLTGRGGSILIVDDPLSASDAFSDVTRRWVNEWYSRSLASRLDNKQTGAIIVIMQRLHQEDLTGYLLEKGGWELLSLPAVAPEDRDIPLWNGIHSWKAGDALQPNRQPIVVLQQIKADLGAEAFNAQYLQNPVPAEGNMLKRSWLREYETAPSQAPSDQIVQSWDTALTANETSKFSVCLTFRVRNKNQYYLIDVFREKCEFPELKTHVIQLASVYKPHAILIEDKASGTPLIQSLRHGGLQRVIAIDPDKDKKTRMHGQTPKLEARGLILPKTAPWLGDFLWEYLAFPGSRYNDQVDALSQFLGWQSNREERACFVVDWGYDDPPGFHPPSTEEILWRLGR
jgi:predicted phage terminase large subunit-like protein